MELLAYTDPGTGAMILQILAASCVGLLFYTKQILAKVKTLFMKKPKGK